VAVFSQENEEKALILHTLPKGSTKEHKRTETTAGDNDEQVQDASQSPQGTDNRRGLSPSTSTIPRLISVVEIIKREYLKTMDAKGAPNIVGLYQYNEMGCLEDEAGKGAEEEARDQSVEDRTKMITEALDGTKK
jgi:hypothetical protein